MPIPADMSFDSCVSVVIVNYNCFQTLEACVRSVLRSRGVRELIVVDSGSTDDSLELIYHLRDNRMRIVRLRENLGLERARNLGAAESKAPYIAFLGPDCEVSSNWLLEPLSRMKRNRKLGAVQCLILSRNNTSVISYAGASVDGDYTGRARNTVRSVRRILYPIGAGFVVKKDAFDFVKGFDEWFFVEWGDVDFGIRLWLAGYEVACAPNSLVYQGDSGLRTDGKAKRIFDYNVLKNLLSLWTKDLSGNTLITKIFPFATLLPLIALAKTRSPDGLRGMGFFLKDLKSIVKKREHIQRTRKIEDERIPMLKLVLPPQLLLGTLASLRDSVFRKHGNYTA